MLVEDEPDQVVVTVRDDGVGMALSRPLQAAGAGRLGLAQSIRGRVSDLGGETVITSAPGEGTEIELRVPRPSQEPVRPHTRWRLRRFIAQPIGEVTVTTGTTGTPRRPIAVMVVDDHPMWRDGVARDLEEAGYQRRRDRR